MKEQRTPTTTAVVAMLGIFAFTSATEAGVTINVTEVGSDVVFTTTGSLDLTGATLVFPAAAYLDGFIPGGDNWYIASGAGSGADTYALTSVDLPFGTSTTFFDTPSSVSGDDFLIWGASGGTPQVGVTVGYVSGSAINSEMVFAFSTIAGFTLIPGTYDFAIPNDTITLNIVPAPAAALPMLGLAGLMGTRRRRR